MFVSLDLNHSVSWFDFLFPTACGYNQKISKLWVRSKDFMCVLEAIWKSQLSMLAAMVSSWNGVINLLNSSPLQSFSRGDRFSFGNRFCLARSRDSTLVWLWRGRHLHGRTSSMALAASSSSSFSVVSYQQHLASRGLNQRLRNGCGDVRNCVSFICSEEGELKASSYDSGASYFLRSGRRRDRRRRRRRIVSGSATMGEESETQHEEDGFGNWIQFPKLSTAGRTLMEDVARSMDRELEPLIHPSFTAPDVRHFTGDSGEGSVILRGGKEGSKIDFLLGSWLHCNLPFGTLNIATLIAMLNAEADSPHLLFEFIQSGPSNLVLVLDLLPRKDLVLEPEYLQRFYESTGLENIKQEFEKSPQAQPYLSTALYIRSVVSPTALLYKLSGEGAEGGLDAVITQLVHPAAKNVFNTWLNAFQNLGNKLNDNEKLHVIKRDEQIKTKGVEVDLSGNMPQLFGQDVADRVLKAFQKGE